MKKLFLSLAAVALVASVYSCRETEKKAEDAGAAIEEAAEASEKIGYPVALKVLSSTIAHKAKLGGVKLGLKNRNEVPTAAQQIAEDVGMANGGHAVSQFVAFVVRQR